MQRVLLGVLMSSLLMGCEGSPAGDSRPVSLVQPPPQAPVPFVAQPTGWRATGEGFAVSLRGDGAVAFEPGRGFSPLQLQTLEVCRGACAPRSSVARLTARGEGEVDRGPGLETLTVQSAGLHQQWRFEQAPRGQGALRVAVGFEGGYRLTGVSAEGAHLQDALSGAEVTYGHATWVDASGRRWPVPVKPEPGALAMAVDESVLQQTRWPAVLDPVISTDLELAPAALAIGDPLRAQRSMAAASIGKHTLTVWVDQRYRAWEPHIFGTWYSDMALPQGVTNRFSFSANGSPQQLPAVAGGTNSFLVVWVQGQIGDIYGAWVSATTGVPGAPFVIAATPTDEGSVRVAASGTNYVVAWQGTNQQGPLWALHLTEGQTVPTAADGPKQLVDVPGVSEIEPSLGFNGTNFVLVWRDDRTTSNIYGLTIAPGALPAASTGTALLAANVANARTIPKVVSGQAGQALVQFTQYLTASSTVIPDLAVRINPLASQDPSPGLQPFAGIVGLQPFGGFFDPPTNKWRLFAIAAGTTPAGLNDILERQLLATGALVGVAPYADVSAVPAAELAVTSYTANGSNNTALLGWSETNEVGTLSNEYNVRLNNAMSANSSAPARAVESQEHPAVATFGSGTEALVAWAHHSNGESDGGGGYDLGFRVFRADAGHSAPVIVNRFGYQLDPEVATLGQRALVTSTEINVGSGRPSSSLRAMQVDPANPVVGPVVVISPAGVSSVSAVGLAPWFLVVWSLGGNDLQSTLVAPGAATYDGGLRPPATAAGPVQETAMAVSPPNGGLLAAVTGMDPYDVVVSRFQQNANFGAFTTVAGAAQVGGPQSGGDLSKPAVDFDGTNFLVVWVDSRNSASTGSDVYGARVSLAGALVDPVGGVPLERSGGRARDVSLSFNGKHHVLASTQDWPDGGTGLVVQWLRTDLTPLYDAGVDTLEPEQEPALTALGPGNTLLVYTRSKLDPTLMANRTFARVLSVGLGDVCATNADCHSGFCTSGVCCNAACTGQCETCLAVNGAPADGTCTPRPASYVCRAAAAGGCDVDEKCDGTTNACPADSFQPASYVCRAATMGGCDVAEHCPGTGAQCPADALSPAGTVCDSPLAPCAATGICSGTTDQCPMGAPKPASTPCRPVAGVCDVAELCDGTNVTCPLDQFVPSTTVCRMSAGACDVVENCTGGNAECPPDQFLGNSVVCRMGVGLCDLDERCSGDDAACPADALKPSGAPCRDAVGVCDLAETCSGIAVGCPPDAKKAATEVCRAGQSECDVAESCDGVANDCPADLLALDHTSCNQGAGQCLAGVCDEAQNGKPVSRYGFGCGNCSGAGAGWPSVALALAALLRRRRRAGTAALAGLVVLMLASPALAADKKLKVAFIGVTNGAGVSVETARSVSETAQTQLTNLGLYEVTGPSDIAAILGVERQKQLLGCSEGSCTAELVGALDADRLVTGDLSKLDDTFVLNLSMVNARTSAVIGRAGRQVNGTLGKLIGELESATYELANLEPTLTAPLVHDRGFGGLVVSVRADGDLLGLAVAGSISAEYSVRWVGGALTIIPKATPGVRAEFRFYPVSLKVVRPYVAAGLTGFSTGLAVRGAGGVALRFSRLQVLADVGYEYYFADFAPARHYSKQAVLLGVGLGWNF